MLKFSTTPVCQPADESPPEPQAKTAKTELKQSSMPATPAAEQLPRKRTSPRPGAITPRQPLNTLPSARAAARAPAAAVPHHDALHHVETQEAPQPRSHAISATLTVSSTLDLDLSERPDTLALPKFPTLSADLRKPDARAMAEFEAASRLRRNS